MKASVMNTDRSGVFAAIHRAAASCGSDNATSRERMCQSAMRIGDRAEIARIATTTLGFHLCINQAARIATAIHMTWKYLFMSNATALTSTTFGTMNSVTTQATRNQR